jgi:hypothetical protein
MRHMGHGGHGPCCFPMAGPYVCFYPVPVMPASLPTTMVREIEVDAETPSKDAFVGGHSEARLTLEYLIEDGAEAPSVSVTVSSAGQTLNWTASDTGVGYHVYDQFGAVKPGSKVTLEASGALARLRWCETLCC